MTDENFDDAEAQQLLDTIACSQARWAAAARHTAAKRQYDEAREAARAWTDFQNAPPPAKAIERLQAHCVDLAAVDPSIRIEWLRADADLDGLGRASATPALCHIAAPCSVLLSSTHASYATVLHELGHCRDLTLYTSDVLQREITAWRWALLARAGVGSRLSDLHGFGLALVTSGKRVAPMC